jgi:uncharacterized protein
MSKTLLLFNHNNMKKSLTSAKHLFLIVLFMLPMFVFSQNCKLEGNWLGTLSAGGSVIRLGFHIEKNDAGYEGYVISPDQSMDHFPMNAITHNGDSVSLKCKKVHLTFYAAIDAKCDTMRGEWEQGGSMPLILWRVDSLPEMERPQEPHPPYPYSCEEVTFPNKKGGFNLAGTLTYPSSGGPFTAVIMITGSGAQDRNEELLGHKPFLVIADYLTKHGIAVLRYDDRGIGGSGGDFGKSTSLDFATDAEAAFAFLKTNSHVNPKMIGLMGHSEGGMIAPIVASRNKNIAFIVLLAGPGTTGKQILISQSELIGRADSVPEKELQENLDVSRNIYALIEKEKDTKKLTDGIRKVIKESTDKMTEEQKKEAGLTDLAINGMIITVTSDWFTTFLRFDPAVYLKKVKCPVLALNGERDLQVPCKENLAAIETALKSGGNTHYMIKEMPGLNHLFQHCASGSPTEYIRISETFSPEVLGIIAKWINEQAEGK